MGDGESARKNGPTVLLLAVLAFLGVRTFTPDSATPSGDRSPIREESRSREERSESGATVSETGEFWEPLIDFRDLDAAKGVTEKINELRRDKLPDLEGRENHYLIACVPDPVESSSGDRFDTVIDAMLRAAEMQGYVLDRYYYPWPVEKGPSKGTPINLIETLTAEKRNGKERGDRPTVQIIQDRSLKDAEDRPWSRLPGLLLFRAPPALHPSPQGESAPEPAKLPRALQIYLVGETATSGLHKKAFLAVLHLLKRSQMYLSPSQPEILVLGPGFSGSQPSLEGIIRKWAEIESKHKPPSFRIISGSATVIDKDRLESVCNPDGAGGRPRGTVSFHATLIPEHHVIGKLLEYLNLGRLEQKAFRFNEGKRFAMLYESNTTFGQEALFGPSALPVWDRGGTANGGPTLFPFPLHVSQVRAAYDKTSGVMKNNSLRLPSFGSRLRLRLGGGDALRDTEPSLHPTVTAVTTERILANMLDVISHERFRYVFILATDVKDRLFLASLVREHCPEARLVFSDTDLMLGHPDFSADLRGSIVGSTYPMRSRNQNWSLPFNGNRARFILPGTREQGYYNATIALLNPKDSRGLLEYGPPFPALHEKINPHVPPVWISIIGEGGLYPLKAFPADEKPYGDYVFSAEEPPQMPKATFIQIYTALWIVPVLGITLLLIYVGWAYGYVVGRSSQWRTAISGDGSWELTHLFWPRSTRFRRRQQFYTGVCLASVLVVYSYLSFIWLIPASHRLWFANSPVEMNSPWGWIMPGILVLLLLKFLLLFVARIKVWMSERRLRPARSTASDLVPLVSRDRPRQSLTQFLAQHRLLLMSIFLLVVMTTYFYQNHRRLPWPDPVELLLFAHRATSLANGVTPAVPILLIGLIFFCWSHCQLRRLYMRDRWAVNNPCPVRGRFLEVEKRHKELVKDLEHPKGALATKLSIVLWLILFFSFCRLSNHFVPAAEDVVTETVLLLMLAVLTLVIVYGWLHLCKVWGSMRRLLHAITLLKIQEGFQHIPVSITNIIDLHQMSEGHGRQVLLSYQREQHGLLSLEYARIAAELNQTLPRGTVPEEMADVMRPCPESPDEAASRHLLDTARACLKLLQHIWDDPRLEERLLKKRSIEIEEKDEKDEANSVKQLKRTMMTTPGPDHSPATRDETAPPQDAEKWHREWFVRAGLRCL